jgi:putative membrane protein insertion efficiency factor
MSPFFGGACRFHPSCSNYAHEAISRHGARRGLALAVKRLLRCQPFTKGGFDPVPETIPTVRGARDSTREPFAPAGTQEPAQ